MLARWWQVVNLNKRQFRQFKLSSESWIVTNVVNFNHFVLLEVLVSINSLHLCFMNRVLAWLREIRFIAPAVSNIMYMLNIQLVLNINLLKEHLKSTYFYIKLYKQLSNCVSYLAWSFFKDLSAFLFNISMLCLKTACVAPSVGLALKADVTSSAEVK